MSSSDLFFYSIDVQNFSINTDKINQLIIGALVFLAVFSWIDLVNTVIRILFSSSSNNNSDPGGGSDENEDEDQIFGMNYNKVETKVDKKRTTKSNNDNPEINKNIINSKIVSAFTITAIAIIGIYTLTPRNKAR